MQTFSFAPRKKRLKKGMVDVAVGVFLFREGGGAVPTDDGSELISEQFTNQNN